MERINGSTDNKPRNPLSTLRSTTFAFANSGSKYNRSDAVDVKEAIDASVAFDGYDMGRLRAGEILTYLNNAIDSRGYGIESDFFM